jgi:ABC-type amino acid transport substrate-binding protein
MAAALLVAGMLACGLPRDSDGTLERVRGGELRVGVTHHPPYDSVANGTVSGPEPRLVEALARRLGARPSFRLGSDSELLEALARRELDVVIAGLHDDSPWNGRVALTKPYHTDPVTDTRYVLATAAGENAWLVFVERFLAERGQTAGASGDATR